MHASPITTNELYNIEIPSKFSWISHLSDCVSESPAVSSLLAFFGAVRRLKDLRLVLIDIPVKIPTFLVETLV